MTDSQLRALMDSSPQEGRRALFDEYCSYVYAIAVSKLRFASREDVEECVSDIFAELYRCFENSQLREGELKGLVSTVARRKAIDAYRRLSPASGRTVSIEDESVGQLAAEQNVAESAERSERSRILMQKINELGEPDSHFIVQHYFYGRTAGELASAAGMSEAAVQKRISRARTKLKKLLIAAGIEEA